METGGGRPWLARRSVRVTVLVVALAATVFTVRGHLPDPARVGAVLRAADWRWAAVALVAQVLSQAAFAAQQRDLLRAAGVTVARRDMLVITYARSAISMAVPAGSAVSAAFALRQFRRRGASTATAAAVAVLSGLASVAGLLALCAAVFGPAAVATWWRDGPDPLIAVAVPAAVVALAAGAVLLRRRAGRYWRTARELGPRAGTVAVAYAAVNWLLDALCLVAAARACSLAVSWHTIAVAYLAAQVVRQVPLTPGGLGLIEASLVAGLSLHGPSAVAAAAVLGYRLVSFWLILPVGLTAYLVLSRRPGPVLTVDGPAASRPLDAPLY